MYMYIYIYIYMLFGMACELVDYALRVLPHVHHATTRLCRL